MLTAGIVMVGGGQGKSLLLPAASGEGQKEQGAFAEGFFTKSVDELMGGSAGTKAQLSTEQSVASPEKKDVMTAKDLAETGTKASAGGEISVSAGLPLAVAENVSITFGGEGLPVPQTTRGLDRSVKEALVSSQTSGDVEKAVGGEAPIEDADELKGSAATVGAPQQSSLVVGGLSTGNGIAQVAAYATFVSKEVTNGEKIRTTAEHTVETKRETKKKGSESSIDVDAKTAVSSVATSLLSQDIGTARLSPPAVLPVSVDVPAVSKVETGVASAKNSRVGSVGWKANVGIAANDVKGGVERGKEMVAAVATTNAVGIHSAVGHSPNAEAVGSKAEVLSTPGSGGAGVKLEGTGAMVTAASVPVAVVDGSSVQGAVVQKHSSVLGNDGGLRADTVDAATTQSQGASGGDAVLVNDGHRMLTATPTSLEVGVSNGSHGWLKIRAELTDGGAVNASVSATSSAGQEMLHRELPSLTAYLQAERLGVNTVVVHVATATTDSRDFSEALSRGDQRGQTQQGSSGDARQGWTADEPVSFAGLEGADVDAHSSTMYGEGGSGGGGWLSVRA